MADPESSAQEAKRIMCKICTEICSSRSALRRHHRNKHATPKTVATDAQSAQGGDKAEEASVNIPHCNICNKTFNTKNGLRMHNTTKHASNKTETSTIKPEESTSKDDAKHYAKQEGESSATLEAQMANCTICDKTFRLQSGLEQHQKTKHAPKQTTTTGSEDQKPTGRNAPKVKNCKCIPCNKSFSSPSALRQHQRTKHITPEEIAEAEGSEEEISKETGNKGKNPVRNNTAQDGKNADNETPYCRACNKSFRNQKAFDDHQRAKHKKNIPRATVTQHDTPNQESLHDCDICGKAFRLESSLEDHKASKHGFGRACHRGPNGNEETNRQGIYSPRHKLNCVGHDLGCEYICPAEWDMWKHMCAGECEFKLEDGWMHSAFQHAESAVCRKIYDSNLDAIRCPTCMKKDKDSIKFDSLTGLINHVESDACSLQLDSAAMLDVYATAGMWVMGELDNMLDRGADSHEQDDEWTTDSDSDSDLDSDSDPEGEGLWWPEYGETGGRVRCLGATLGCRERFDKASDMLFHLEANLCDSYMTYPYLEDLFNKDMEKEGRQLYVRKGGFLRCPHCKGKPGGKFRRLSGLLRHAESNICRLKVREGPVYQVYSALLIYAVKEAIAMDEYELDDPHDMCNYMGFGSDDEGGYDWSGNAFFRRHGW